MTLDTIAYGPEDHLLVTYDGAALLAYDAHTEAPKWSLVLAAPIAAVALVGLDAFPGGRGASPWRQSGAARWVVAVDTNGLVHVVDGTSGDEVTALGPFGAPVAVAAGPGGRFALATGERVHVWQSGERAELPERASALAFSLEGTTLAVGAVDGTLRFLSATPGAPPVETFCAVVHGGVSDLVQHPNGNWIVAGREGIHVVSDAGPTRLRNLPTGVVRVRVDPRGERLAAQLTERSVAVYSWPAAEVATRIDYLERPVRGLAWGPGAWLGVGLDLGDANKIDVLTTAAHRTDTHPGRGHNSWMLTVQGPPSRLSAKEADEIARMKNPWHVPAPPKNSGAGGKIGIGVVLSLGALFLRIVIFAGRTSSSYVAPSYEAPGPAAASPSDVYGSTATCDMSCARLRVTLLQIYCGRDGECRTDAAEALAALRRNDCSGATTAIDRITMDGARQGHASDVAGESLASARRGVELACAVGAGPVTHVSVVRLTGTALDAAREPLSPPHESQTAGALWAAPDGAVFASTRWLGGTTVYRREATSGPWVDVTRRRSGAAANVWGTSSRSAVMMASDSLTYWDGTAATELALPSPKIYAVGGMGDDLLVVGAGPAVKSQDDDDGEDPGIREGQALYRRRLLGGEPTWKPEAVAPHVQPKRLWSGKNTVLLAADAAEEGHEAESRLYQRSAGGRWTERRWWGAGPHPSDDVVDAAWIGARSEIFLATARGIYRSTDGGASFANTTPSNDGFTATGLWGRSASDVFAATTAGVKHWDGKTWSDTPYTGRALAISGNATDVYVLEENDEDD
ncbi:MAG: hypothetical protein JWP97_6152 [Labilithrix sp.]|nr:hypothetical protein [Labilithrix sp.]